MKELPPRRQFLATAAATAGTLMAGCSSYPDAKFQLETRRVDDLTRGPSTSIRQYLIDPLDVNSTYSIELSNEYKRAKVNELVDTGTVSARAWDLSSLSKWGPTWRDRRTCFEYDDTYYRVWVESREEVKRERWVFYLDWDEQNPAEDATISSLSDNSLSEQDQPIVEAAQEMIPHRSRRDFERNSLKSFSVIFHEELDADESDLVPDPPFDYIEYDGEYFRAVSEQGPVEKTEQTFTVEPVGDSFEEYRQYAAEAYPDARFSDVKLSDGVTEILDEVTSGEALSYEEEPPLSAELEEVLKQLTIAEYLEPHDSYDDPTYFYNALAEYESQWYEFNLIIYP